MNMPDFQAGDSITIKYIQSMTIDVDALNPTLIKVEGYDFIIHKGGLDIDEYDIMAQKFVDLTAEKEELEYRVKELEEKIDELKEQQALNT
ncbi:MAG: hypothetical protein WCO84_09460 [bacterium]